MRPRSPAASSIFMFLVFLSLAAGWCLNLFKIVVAFSEPLTTLSPPFSVFLSSHLGCSGMAVMQKLDPGATIIIERDRSRFTKTETHDPGAVDVGLLGLAGLIRSGKEHAKFESRRQLPRPKRTPAIDFADGKKQHG